MRSAGKHIGAATWVYAMVTLRVRSPTSASLLIRKLRMIALPMSSRLRKLPKVCEMNDVTHRLLRGADGARCVGMMPRSV